MSRPGEGAGEASSVAPAAGAGGVTRVVMPKWGLSMQEGRIVSWLVAEGASVRRGEELFEIETEKSAGAVESPADGVLRCVLAPQGAVIPVGMAVALLAPAEVEETVIEAAAEQARALLASGEAPPVEAPAVVRVEVDLGRLEANVVGEGRQAVVLLHGYGGDRTSWELVQERLAGGARRVFALDLPGHGASTKVVGDASLETFAGSVLGFLDQVGLSEVHLVGHSFGAAVAVSLAHSAPERVRSLGLVAPCGFGSAADVEYLRGYATAASRRELRPLLAHLFADEQRVTAELVEERLRAKRIDGAQAALEAVLKTLLDGDAQSVDVRPLLAGSGIPRVAVWGTRDRILPPPDPPSLEDLIEVVLVPEVGHMPQLEAPEPTARALLEVLESSGVLGSRPAGRRAMSDESDYINPIRVKRGGLCVAITLPSSAPNPSGPMAEHLRRVVQVGEQEVIELPLSEEATDRAAVLYDELLRHSGVLARSGPSAHEPGAQVVELPMPDAVVARLGGVVEVTTRLNQAPEAGLSAGRSTELEGRAIDVYRELIVVLDPRAQSGEH